MAADTHQLAEGRPRLTASALRRKNAWKSENMHQRIAPEKPYPPDQTGDEKTAAPSTAWVVRCVRNGLLTELDCETQTSQSTQQNVIRGCDAVCYFAPR